MIARAQRRRPLRRALLASGLMLVVAIGAGGLWLYHTLQGSLPILDGEVVLAGLTAPVNIERDSLGIPTITGGNRSDVALATGFLHAQERFFQMDLLRRAAAGELAALFGQSALPLDRQRRLHRFRSQAHRVLAKLPPKQRALLQAYSRGVTGGIRSLKQLPFEYLILGASPTPWAPEDTLLVVYAMYLDLQGMGWQRESALGVMKDTQPPELYAFLTPWGTEWDAPLMGGPLDEPPLPGPEVIDLRGHSRDDGGEPPTAFMRRQAWATFTGSNSWAVAGAHSAHGGAVLANDMHLPLGVPNIWYRLALSYAGEDGRQRQVSGITLPGAPVITVGSNGRVAWGFTNSEVDLSDLVLLESAPAGSGDYMTPEGPRRFTRHRETIHIKDGPAHELEILWSQWGPVVDRDHQGRLRALRWVAHDPVAVNLGLLGLESAGTVEQALVAANHTGIPAQNFIVADANGDIGWTIAGPIPRRFGHDGRTPSSWANGSRYWDGWLPPAAYPRILTPSSGRLWTANARVADGKTLKVLGDGGYALGARAHQIRNRLMALEYPEERDMLALQLDDRALFLERWRALLLKVLTPQALAANPRRAELKAYVERWGGHASVDSIGYRVVRTFRALLAAEVFAALTAPCRQAASTFDYSGFPQQEDPLWRLVRDRPLHLLSLRYDTWQAQLLAAVDTTLDHLTADGSELKEHTWGEYNTSRIRHPLSRFLPGLGRWLDMAALPLPGDSDMPRVQAPQAGASQRMVVSPGREARGIFHMPGGQSGHPLSSHYRDGHEAWIKGEPTAFLPGPAEHELVLLPLMF